MLLKEVMEISAYYHITVVNASPYGSRNAVKRAATVLMDKNVDLVVMHTAWASQKITER